MAKGNVFCFIALVGFFMLSCGSDESGLQEDPSDFSGREFDEFSEFQEGKPCERAEVSLKENCHFVLEPIGHGQTFTAKHEEPHDLHNVNPKGRILGVGQWSCEQGEWKIVTAPKCIFCGHRLDFEQCLNKTKIPVCMFNEEC